MNRSESKKWLTEYHAFMADDATVTPREVTHKVFATMEKLIHPSAQLVFVKILGFHLAVGFLSLSVCHQFGMNPFGTDSSLDTWFMAMWGHNVCMIVCGVLFLGLSLLAAGYFLSIEEVRAFKRTEFLQTLALGLCSLLIFAIFGAELALTVAGLWLLGALLGGFLATEAVWKIKRYKIGAS